MVRRVLAMLLAAGVVTVLSVPSGLAKSSGRPKRLDQQVADTLRTAITAGFGPAFTDVTPSHLGEVQPDPPTDVGVSSQSLQVKRGVFYVYAHDGTPFGNTAEVLVVEFANTKNAQSGAKLLVRTLETQQNRGGPRRLTPVRKLGSVAYATRSPAAQEPNAMTSGPVVLFAEGKYLGMVDFINNSTPESFALRVAKAIDRGLGGSSR